MSARPEQASYTLGLVGAGIGGSLTPAMQEREGRESGLAVSYRIVDAEALGLGVEDLPEILTWAERLGYDGLNITHPFKQAVVPLLDELSEDAADLGAVNTVLLRDGRRLGRNTDWSGYGRAFRQVLPDAVEDRVVLVGAGGAGVAVGYALLHQGAEHVAVVDADRERADACVVRLAKRFGDDRVAVATDLEGTLAHAQGVVNATPVGMNGHAGTSVPAGLLRADLWVSDVVYFPLETELIGLARERGCRVLPGGGMAVGQAIDAFELFTGRPADAERMARHFAELTSVVRKAIATVSVSGVLAEKLEAVAAAGFDGIELFDNDLVSSPLSPDEVRARCADLGLRIELFQPVRDIEGVAPDRFDAVLHRVRTKLEVMARLGTSTVLACSNVQPDASDDVDLTAEQLHRVGELAAEHGVTVAYEALAWGRHVNRVGQAWEAVVRADHPAITLAVDTFHMLSRGDDGSALVGIPGDRIGFLQVADAPLLDMNVLEWSRHFRCFPGQGTLDVTGVVAAVLEAGYRGPLSLEVFSDVVREVEPAVTARDALRSLLFLEDQVAAVVDGPARELVTPASPPPVQAAAGFLELAGPVQPAADLLTGLGFARHGRHLSKPVEWWRNGDAHIVLNAGTDEPEVRATALGIVAPPVEAVAARAKSLLWPAVDTTRGEGEAALPGITSPSGLHVFVSDAPGGSDDWQRDFEVVGEAPADGWLGIDHVGAAVAPDQLNEEVGFFRTVFDLAPGQVEEFMEPHGRLRSRALRPAKGDLRVVLNCADTAPGHAHPVGVNQVAFAVADVVSAVAALRAHGVPLMAVPDNYYVDLDARFALPPDRLDLLREHHLLYDRIGDGELLHAYTQVLPAGFYVELLERRGGYDGYGSAGTHVRLAMQSA